jgi:hypothetical protein
MMRNASDRRPFASMNKANRRMAGEVTTWMTALASGPKVVVADQDAACSFMRSTDIRPASAMRSRFGGLSPGSCVGHCVVSSKPIRPDERGHPTMPRERMGGDLHHVESRADSRAILLAYPDAGIAQVRAVPTFASRFRMTVSCRRTRSR